MINVKRGLLVGFDESSYDLAEYVVYFLPLFLDESGYTLCSRPETVYIPHESVIYNDLLDLLFSYVEITLNTFGDFDSLVRLPIPDTVSIYLE